MSEASGEGLPPPPALDDLAGLGADDWAHIVKHTRRALGDLPDALVTPEIARVRALPTSRLVGGPSRRRLARVLVTTPLLWRTVRERAAAGASPGLAGWLRGRAPAPTVEGAPTPGGASSDAAEGLRVELARQKQRARGFQEERDEALRQLEGTTARADAAERRAGELEDTLATARRRITELEARLAEVDEQVRRAVDRERRRSDSTVESLREELRGARRSLEQRRRAQRDARASEPRASSDEVAPRDAGPAAVAPGRPTRLPERVRPGTQEEAELLLGRNRRVVVDGYNVTKTHRPQLGLQEQRVWLLRLLAGAVAGRGIAPEVVFDGEVDGAGGGDRARGVRVTFTRGMSADDEIEFRIAALPEGAPVTVVTDDRELRERVRRYGADVIGTGPFLWTVG